MNDASWKSNFRSNSHSIFNGSAIEKPWAFRMINPQTFDFGGVSPEKLETEFTDLSNPAENDTTLSTPNLLISDSTN